MSLRELTLTDKLFYNKSVVLYGASDTGKSSVIKNALYLLKPFIFQGMVFAGNDDCFQAYCAMFPLPFIRRTISAEILQKIWDRQDILTSVYNKATDIKILISLCNKLPSNDLDEKINDLNDSKKRLIEITESKFNENRSKLKTLNSKINEKYKDILKNIYLKYININESYFNEIINDLDDNEKYSLKYRNLNPNFLLIIDDMSTAIKKLKGSIFEEIFYQGRHKYITLLLSLQDDKPLISELRKNASVNIFTTSQCTNALFTRTSNSYDKSLISRALAANKETFSSEKETFYKLIYIRKTDEFFKFMADTDIPSNFMFGSKSVIEYCNRIKSDSKIMDSNNQYYKYFKE